MKNSIFRKLRIILTVVPLFVAQNAFTQNIDDVLNLSNESIPFHQLWAFMKNEKSTINHYNGQTIANIPIYFYENKDFNIPISISIETVIFNNSRATTGQRIQKELSVTCFRKLELSTNRETA